jgi:hypothetical protein
MYLSRGEKVIFVVCFVFIVFACLGLGAKVFYVFFDFLTNFLNSL